jgi:hypothetical protein
MSPTERLLSLVSLWISITGTLWALFILFAVSMSDNPGDGPSGNYVAFPPVVIAFVLSMVSLILGLRRGTARLCVRSALPALVISGGTILLIVAALLTYNTGD